MQMRFILVLLISMNFGCDEDNAPGEEMVPTADMAAIDMGTGPVADGATDVDAQGQSDAESEPEMDAEPEPEMDAEPIPDDPIEALFAPPTNEELEQIREAWAGWDVSVNDWEVLGEGDIRGFQVAVISHRVEGHIHYGAVRYPADYQPRNSYPVLVVNHGGNNGVSVNTFGAFSRDCYRNFFVIAASYRSEELRTESLNLGNLQSGGENSVIDRDVNDVIALLNGVLENMVGADEDRIVAYGGSRGAGVTGLLSARDPRIQRAGVLYGATDHMHPDVRAAVERAVETGRGAGNPVNQTAMRNVEAYLEGDLTLAQARQALIRSSVVYFAEDLPAPYHHHHGIEDRAVPVAQGRALAERMTELGIDTPAFEYTEYEGGEHTPNSMPGSLEAIQGLLCEID